MSKIVKKGFTLVELLIVISIIGILMTISIVGIKAAREKSKVSKAKNDISNISLAVSMLYADTRLYAGAKPNMAIDVIAPQSCTAGVDCFGRYDIDNPGAGLITHNWSVLAKKNWNGPYYKGAVKDPWNENYMISDYNAPDTNRQTVSILSYGKDKNTNDDKACDDVYKILYIKNVVPHDIPRDCVGKPYNKVD